MRTAVHLKVGQIASTAVHTITAEVSLRELVQDFSREKHSCVVVVEGNCPIGIVTERDLLRLLCAGYDEQRSVRAVMSAPLLTAHHDLPFATAQNMLSTRNVRHLVLVDAQGQLFGVVTETDFRRHISYSLFKSIEHLSAVTDSSSILIAPDVPLIRALELMASRRLDHLVIGQDNRAEGIITERDVPRFMVEHVDIARITTGQMMSRPLVSIPTHWPVVEAARRLIETNLRHLVVVDEQGQFAGVLSQHRMLERLSAVLLEEGHQYLARQVSASEQRFRDFVEHLPIPLCHVNAQQDVVYINQQFTSLLGYTLADTPTMTAWWTQAYPHETQRSNAVRTWRRHVEQAHLTGGPIAPEEYRVTCRDGSVRVLEIGGITLGQDLLMTIVDMTERRQAEEKLHNQLQELRRWQAVMLDREDRVLDLKREVNTLLLAQGLAPRYPSAGTPAAQRVATPS